MNLQGDKPKWVAAVSKLKQSVTTRDAGLNLPLALKDGRKRDD